MLRLNRIIFLNLFLRLSAVIYIMVNGIYILLPTLGRLKLAHVIVVKSWSVLYKMVTMKVLAIIVLFRGFESLEV